MEIEAWPHALRWLWNEFQWPPWASASCILLAICLIMQHVSGMRLPGSKANGGTSGIGARDPTPEYFSFRRKYLVVYFLVMFADWLQGTHMYSLYESYGLDVSTLFLTGFLSSAMFGSVIGPLADQYGRRKACLVFCVLEIAINIMENIPSMGVLLAGRVLGGISTSILFSAFESWMVTEHRARGFKEEWITKTFSLASEGNGLLAVLAGIVAQFAADGMGEIGPFRLAVGVTFLAMMFVFQWSENYGSQPRSNQATVAAPIHTTWSSGMVAVGLCYSLFEGAMYVFVFLWYPTLYEIVPDNVLPSGLVFSSFMLCISIGGKLYDSFGGVAISDEKLAVALCVVSSVALYIPTLTTSYQLTFVGFLVFEMCVGAFSPCSGTLRSRYFPNERLSTILGFYRLPTNVLVVLGTGGSSYVSRHTLFTLCSATMAVAATCAATLLVSRGRKEKSKSA